MTSPCFQSRIKVSSLLCNFATSVILSSFVTRKERERKRKKNYQDRILDSSFSFSLSLCFISRTNCLERNLVASGHVILKERKKRERRKERKKVRSMIFEKVGELVRNESTRGFQLSRARNSSRISIPLLSYLPSRCSFLHDLAALRSSKYVMLAACLLAFSRNDVMSQLGSRSYVT